MGGVGDKVLVTVVETKRPDPPSQKEQFDAALREASERRYLQYLKTKYEAGEQSRGGRESRRRTTRS